MVNFHGKKLPTQILDTEVKVQNVTSVISRTVEITPTPTWQTLTITTTVLQPPAPPQFPAPLNPPTPHQPPVPDQPPAPQQPSFQIISHNDDILTKKALETDLLPKPVPIEQPRRLSQVNDNLKSLGSFESFQAYLKNIQALERGDPVSYYSEGPKATPTSSISTLYISGSVPGQFSTVLITTNPYEDSNQVSRARREISPSRPEPLPRTEIPRSSDDIHTELHNTEIISSFTPDKEVAGEDCSGGRVTITVTKTGSCQP